MDWREYLTNLRGQPLLNAQASRAVRVGLILVVALEALKNTLINLKDEAPAKPIS
jgi:hypothetical protein